MTAPEEVTDNTQRAFEAVSTATIATALFRRGLRNTVFHGLYSVSPVNKRMVGAAFTVRYIPAREHLDTLNAFEDYQHPQRAAIEQTPPGFVLVADCRGNDRAAAVGHIFLTRPQVRGAAGFVTDGSVRDSAQVATLPLPAVDAAVRRVFDDGAYQRARPCRSPLSDDRDPISVVAPPRMTGVRRWILSH